MTMNEITVTLEGKEYQIDIQKAKELGSSAYFINTKWLNNYE